MSEQAENEFICEWLGWKRFTSEGTTIGWGRTPQCTLDVSVSTPTFTDPASAWLIAEAFAARGIEFDILYSVEERHWEASTWEDDGFGGADMTVDEHHASGPLAIRSAALAYIRGAT